MKKTAQKREKEGGGRSSKKPSKKSMWLIKFVGFVLSFFFLSFAFSFFRRFPLVMRGRTSKKTRIETTSTLPS